MVELPNNFKSPQIIGVRGNMFPSIDDLFITCTTITDCLKSVPDFKIWVDQDRNNNFISLHLKTCLLILLHQEERKVVSIDDKKNQRQGTPP